MSKIDGENLDLQVGEGCNHYSGQEIGSIILAALKIELPEEAFRLLRGFDVISVGCAKDKENEHAAIPVHQIIGMIHIGSVYGTASYSSEPFELMGQFKRVLPI